MTDRPFPDEPEKPPQSGKRKPVNAPVRQWRRRRRSKTPPGQPEVTRFRKASGHRTLIVSLLSLALVIALASGGDRLLSALKGAMRRKPTPHRRPPPGRRSMSVKIWAWTVTRLACSDSANSKAQTRPVRPSPAHPPCQQSRPP